MRLRLLLSTFVALVPVLVCTGSPASAQASTCPPGAGPPTVAGYPPSTGALAVSTTEVTPGQPVAVSGGGFPSNSTITLLFDGTQVGTARPNSACVLNATITIPADATPGPHTITATGGGRELRATVRVLGVRVARDGNLPRTGSSSSVPTGIAGIVLVGVGSLAVIGARRRTA